MRVVHWICLEKDINPNRKKGFYTNHVPKKQEEVVSIFVWSGLELWSLFKIFKIKIKNLKLIAVDVLIKAYVMVPRSWADLIWPDVAFSCHAECLDFTAWRALIYSFTIRQSWDSCGRRCLLPAAFQSLYCPAGHSSDRSWSKQNFKGTVSNDF